MSIGSLNALSNTYLQSILTGSTDPLGIIMSALSSAGISGCTYQMPELM